MEGNLALKIQPSDKEAHKEAHDKASPLYAFPRVVHNPPAPPVFIVEHPDVARLAFKMPPVPALPYSVFVDDQAQVHFELNHSSYFPSKSISTFLASFINPNRVFYDLLRTKIIGGSVIHGKGERRLIGGTIGTFFADQKLTEIKLMGTLSPEETADVDPEIRRNATNLMSRAHHALLRWLGVEKVLSTPCIIPVKRMHKIGWDIQKLNLKGRWEKFRDGLPYSLIKKQLIFFDRDYEENCRQEEGGRRCSGCQAWFVEKVNE